MESGNIDSSRIEINTTIMKARIASYCLLDKRLCTQYQMLKNQKV
jgi:hypothetical protein